MAVEALGEPCAVKIASTVRRGGVGVPEQSGPGLLPYSFRQDRTAGPSSLAIAEAITKKDTGGEVENPILCC